MREQYRDGGPETFTAAELAFFEGLRTWRSAEGSISTPGSDEAWLAQGSAESMLPGQQPEQGV